MSAMATIRFFGSFSAVSISWSAQVSALIPADALGGDAGRHAAKVLDQRQAQHDRQRPQLAEIERRRRLVGGHKAGETFGVHAPVAVRNDLQRDVVDPGKTGGSPLQQARQFPAVGLRQVPLGGANLLLDQIEVIQQPFAGGGDLAVGGHRLGHQPVDTDQNALVLRQPRQQLVRSASRTEFVESRQRPAMLLHLLGAEQLRAQRRGVAVFPGAVSRETHRFSRFSTMALLLSLSLRFPLFSSTRNEFSSPAAIG